MNRQTIRTAVMASLCLGASLCAPTAARAAVVINMTQSGANVVASYTGSLNLTGLTFGGVSTGSFAFVMASVGEIAVGPSSFIGSTPAYSGVTGPASFGSGGFKAANSGSGTLIDIANGALVLSPGYASGSAISGNSTWNSATFSSLGVTPGSYVYSWSTDSITVNIGSPVPEPSTAALAAAAAGLAFFRGAARRFKQR